MTNRFLGAALALASLALPTIAAAQVADRASAPSGTAPLQAPCVVQDNGTCAAVQASVPLPTQMPDGTPIASSTLTANGNFFVIDTAGYRGISLFFSGPGGQGILNIDGSNDNASWQTLPFMNTGTTAYTSATQTTSVSYYIPASVRYIRARLSGYTSGTYSVTAYLRQLNIDPGQVNGSVNATNVTGNNPAGTTDTGNPLKIGGVGSDGAPNAVATGQRVNGWFSRYGAQVTRLSDVNGQGVDADNVAGDVAGVNNYRLRTDSTLRVFDGTQLARVRDANTASGTSGVGLLGVGNLGYDGTTWRAARVDGNGYSVFSGSSINGGAMGGSFRTTGGVGSTSVPVTVANGQGARTWLGVNGQTIIATGSNGGVTFSNVWSSANGIGDTQNNARPLIVAPVVASSGNAAVVQLDANAASGTSGTGLLGAGILGQSRSTLPGLTDNTYNAVVLDTRGNLRARLVGSNSTTPNDSGTTYTSVLPAPSASTETSGAPLAVGNFYWSGATVVAARGDTTGAYTVEKGGPSIATSQTSVGTTAALVAPARVGRNKVTVSIGVANSCALGNAGVTLSTGFPLQPVAGASITLDTAAAIYVVCSATTTVSDVETF